MKILETNNYGRFVVSPFNRDVTRTAALEASMRRHGFLSAYPLHVKRLESGRLEIVAGHHRFTVAKKLGIPVKFVEVKEEVHIHELERATNRWSMKDWLISHVRTGKEDYAVLLQYHKRTGISIGICVALLSNHADGGRINTMFKEGEFRVGDMKHAVIVGEIIILCKSLGITFSRDKLFVAALEKVVLAEGFDAETMKKKIAAHQQLMKKQPTMKDYITLLDRVYNHASKVKIALAFNAEEAVRQRTAALTVPVQYSGTSRRRRG